MLARSIHPFIHSFTNYSLGASFVPGMVLALGTQQWTKVTAPVFSRSLRFGGKRQANRYIYFGWSNTNKKGALKKTKWWKNDKLDQGSVILYKVIKKALPEETRSRRSTSESKHSKGEGPAAEAPAASEEASKWPVWPESSHAQSMGGGGGEKFLCYLLLHQSPNIADNVYNKTHTKSTEALRQGQRSQNGKDRLCQKPGLYSRQALKWSLIVTGQSKEKSYCIKSKDGGDNPQWREREGTTEWFHFERERKEQVGKSERSER